MRYHHPMGYRGAGLVSEEDTRNGKTCPEPPGGTCDNAVIADDTGGPEQASTIVSAAAQAVSPWHAPVNCAQKVGRV